MGGQDTMDGRTQAGDVTVVPPREGVELMELPEPASQLWWQHMREFFGQGWYRLESVGQIADLVNALGEEIDGLTLEDDDPVTRYAQMCYLGEGRFQLEIAKVEPEGGAFNWRIGVGAHAEHAGNQPNTSAEDEQLLNRAQLIEVLTSWAQGHGLPLGYGAALHCYGGATL
ncbi:hypothetical protein HMPREF2863_10540 [Micrococcus sp. HMSC067E09]|nr:hypothetical protein HMPREF2863_10540 [Micrococcus sp. HMSC067E09]